MIIGLWHQGSGIGDQLFCYLATRTTANRLGTDFGMIGKFKGDFIKLDKGLNINLPYKIDTVTGKISVESSIPLFESSAKYYDPEFNFIEDNSIVDGCTLQDERYFDIKQVKQWLITEPLTTPENTCIIAFRGGEFSLFPDLFLPLEYWNEAIDIMLRINPNMVFQVHTDDKATAELFFPNYEIIHNPGFNWRSIRNAKYTILSNSAFGIIPALLSDAEKIIAPRKWARRNLNKEWSMPQNYYSRFYYI